MNMQVRYLQIIDSVLAYDTKSGRTHTAFAERLAALSGAKIAGRTDTGDRTFFSFSTVAVQHPLAAGAIQFSPAKVFYYET
jgi:hypothetical protein